MMLEDHETFCPVCKGTGRGKSWMTGEFEITPECDHCLGDGILDWLERITGKQRPVYDFQTVYAEEAAKYLREEIDQGILDEIIEGSNKMIKEGKNDNGVIPELLLHSTIKQNIKSKKE